MPGCSDKKHSDCRLPTCSNVESTGCNQCHGKDVVDYHEICPSPFCDHYCKGISAQEIFAKYKDAVMEAHAEFQVTPVSDPTLNPLDGINYDAGTLETVYAHFDCTFIDQHVIIAPANKIFLPPNYTLAYNQWPFNLSQINSGEMQSNIESRANRIFIDVTNVNGSNKSYTYQVDIIGVYMLGDLAILYIDAQATWNTNIPCIKRCHSHLRLACSRRYRTGLPAYVIGHSQVANASGSLNGGIINSPSILFQSTEKTIAKTLIASTRALDRSGAAPQELVLVQGNIGNMLMGAPVLNAYGHMLAYLTLNDSSAKAFEGDSIFSLPPNFNTPFSSGLLAGGPSSFFFIDVLRVLLCSLSARSSDFVETASSLLGDYVRYVHGGVGLAYQVWKGDMYMSSIDATDGSVRTRFDPLNPGQYLIPEYRKENLGVRVFGLTVDPATLAGRFNGSIFLPGALSVPIVPAAGTQWVDSPLNLSINDQLVFFENCPLGDQNDHAIAPLLMLSRMKVGDTLLIKARTAASNYQTEFVQSVVLVRLPLFFNYPLASYQSFPWENLSAYPVSFQGTWPQDPRLQGGNPSHPSWSVPTITVV